MPLIRVMALATIVGIATPLAAQTVTLPLTSTEWTATDTIKFADYLGRPALYINSGVAMSHSASFRNGTIDFDIAANATANNLGIAFRAQRADAFEVVFWRPGSSGTDEAMQYAPAINSIAAAWQIYHGPGAGGAVDFPREQWIHVRVRVMADSALIYWNNGDMPVLVVPHLVLGGAGRGIALWASGFGRGAWYSNISYTADDTPYTAAAGTMPTGTIKQWMLSNAVDASTVVPGVLPDLTKMRWQLVDAEAPGLVLVNRYRRSPSIAPPNDLDQVLANRVAGSKVVFARTTIVSSAARLQLMHIGYSDNVVVYCNGVPLYAGTNAAYFRDLGYFHLLGDAVYLPLRAGRNEVVFAVTEYFGGWAFSGRLAQ